MEQPETSPDQGTGTGTGPGAGHLTGSHRFIVADVAPLDVDGVRTVAVGAGLWLAGFVCLLPFYGRLQDEGRGWWLWACLAGFGLGMLGLAHCWHRRAARSGAPTGPTGD